MQFGKELLRWRTTLGLTQSGAAERLGTSERNVQNWEQERYLPRGLTMTYLREKISGQNLSKTS